MGNACTTLDIPDFPVLSNSSGTFDALNASLFHAFGESVSLSRDTIAELYCATSREGPCYGICPNADLAGLGVRLAFYFQAALNACLVALSPEDSPGAAWGATLLTAAIVIPAIAQKKQGELTLYHATLVLDFTTLSSLASLAVAPLCPMWREKGLAQPLRQRYLDQKEQQAEAPSPNDSPLLGQRDESDLGLMPFPVGPESEEGTESEDDEPVPQHHAPNKSNVTYQRIVLSCALLAQVGLQWGYAVLLFTSPYFAEKSCSRSTVIVLFGAPLKAADINQQYFYAWVLWLVFNMGVTFTWGAFLVLSGAASRRHNPARRSRLGRFLARVDPDGARRRQAVMWSALMVAVFFVGVAEMQQVSNCFALSENNDWGFGQVAALLLVLVPIWQIVVVLNHRWFGRRERLTGDPAGGRSRDEHEDARRDEENEQRPGFLLAHGASAVASSLSFSPSSVTLRSRG
ncbi:hypothetical protein AURDEDRAFT_150200 [Auricularia subglabra TFB-10046 SS5]|nr:hypothetical protein AURDEDRAFT_150200 [Auricularia subglabra TFB-10046 SS5]